MKDKTHRLMLAVLAAIFCLTCFCTIKEDELGSPIHPGEPQVKDDTTKADTTVTPGKPLVPYIILNMDSSYVKPSNKTVRHWTTIRITLLSDTAAGAPGLANQVINVTTSPDRRGDSLSTKNPRTNANGEVSIRFSSDTTGIAELVFNYVNPNPNIQGAQAKIQIEVTNEPPRNIFINASPSVLMADGSSKSVITVQVKNDFNNPIVGDTIRFASTAGMITAAGVTDAEGKTTASLTSDRRNTTAVITAFLKSDATRSARITVEFTGVTISSTVNPSSIKPNAADISTILATVRDASGNPLIGERISFELLDTSRVTVTGRDTVTDNRGEARARISSKTVAAEISPARIAIRAAGAYDTAVVTFSSDGLKIVPLQLPPDGCFRTYDDDNDSYSTYEIQFRDGNNDAGAAYRNARVEVTVTIGNINDIPTPDTDTLFSATYTTGNNANRQFTMKNPNFSGMATIFVKAYRSNDTTKTTTAVIQQCFKAREVYRIELTVTPAVINTNGAKALLTATAFDSKNMRVRGAAISFNIDKGPGGGEYIEFATATTAADGTANSYLISGTVPSAFRGVHIKASNSYIAGSAVSAVMSNTVQMTIAGPPAFITIKRNLSQITKQLATYGKALTALVSDINGNPVADDTPVTFSATITGYPLYKRDLHCTPLENREGEKCTTTVVLDQIIPRNYDTISGGKQLFPPFLDFNWNKIPDCHASAPRKQIREWANCDTSEACITENLNYYYVQLGDNFGNTLYCERFLDPAYNVLENYVWGDVVDHPLWRIPSIAKDRQTTILIERTILTKEGIADNELIYGQSDAWNIEVTVWAEAQGLVTSTPERFILPILEGDERYWDPFR